MSTILTRSVFISPFPDLGLNTNNKIFFYYLSSSAIADNFLSLWLSSRFSYRRIQYPPSSFSGASGYSSLKQRHLPKISGKLSSPVIISISPISSICFTAALTVFLIFAVSQFTLRFTLLRISFKIRTFSDS